MSERRWGHDQLQSDLAAHLSATRDRLVWEDMQIGPAGSPRPDVYTVPKSFTKFRPLAYEIKISVADFRRDVTAGKWQSYLEFASGVTFAVPAGLITKADVPPGCGLMVRNEDGWRTLKAPTLKHVDTLPKSAWLKLIIDGIERQQKTVRSAGVNEYRVRQALCKKYGERVAQLVSDIAGAEDRLEYALNEARVRHNYLLEGERERYLSVRASLERESAQIDSARAILAEALGLDPGESSWVLIQRLRAARDSLCRDAEVMRLRKIVDRVKAITLEVEHFER